MLIARILLACIIGLVPVLVYCLLLIGLNGRRRASMIPGTWDFAGVLLATSGFLFAGGPLILAGFNSSWRRFFVHGQIADWRTISGEGDALAMTVWALYFILVIGGAAMLINRRRHITVLYNVDTEHFPAALEWTFGRLGIVWKKADKGYELKRPRDSVRLPWRRPNGARDVVEPISAPVNDLESPGAFTALSVQALPGNCNVTMHWWGDGDIRRRVEGELYQLLTSIRAVENPALNWLVTAATILFGIIAAALVFVILTSVRNRITFGML